MKRLSRIIAAIMCALMILSCSAVTSGAARKAPCSTVKVIPRNSASNRAINDLLKRLTQGKPVDWNEICRYLGVCHSNGSCKVNVPNEQTPPTDEPTEPSVNPTVPSVTPAKPTAPPVNPTEPSVDPTVSTVVPAKPTAPPVNPTEPSVDPTVPTVVPAKPTAPPVNPTEPSVKPTVPSVTPTESAAPTVSPTDPPETTQEETPGFNTVYELRVLELVNAERIKYGLSPLGLDSGLTKVARLRAKEITKSFSHTRPDGRSCFTAASDLGVAYRAAGENIAYGYRTPEQVVTGWMNSEGHRKNILSSSFGKLGVGCYESGGVLYWSQFFTD